jgi:hypothetical protein
MASFTRSHAETVTASDDVRVNIGVTATSLTILLLSNEHQEQDEEVVATPLSIVPISREGDDAFSVKRLEIGMNTGRDYFARSDEQVGVVDSVGKIVHYVRLPADTVVAVDGVATEAVYERRKEEIVTAVDNLLLSMDLARLGADIVTALDTILPQAVYLRSHHDTVTAIVLGLKQEWNRTTSFEFVTAVDTVRYEITTRLSGTATRNARTGQISTEFGFAGATSYVTPPPDVTITVDLVDQTGNALESIDLDPLIFTEDNTWRLTFAPAYASAPMVRVSVTGTQRVGVVLLPITNIDDPGTLGHPSPRNIIRRS